MYMYQNYKNEEFSPCHNFAKFCQKPCSTETSAKFLSNFKINQTLLKFVTQIKFVYVLGKIIKIKNFYLVIFGKILLYYLLTQFLRNFKNS